ncbi:hypothetical protein RHMOL_Rhmol13G0232400 [Rhododendron molle]|uniref:Uncharacterized protein n=1 Tax=Rhododendron molle TaxID=49168 RepID=A0ACC0L9S9_RHOML|nr:hypothetical protein RHMOL_Rhmol13G0232400 [Rhododendron molle]
MALAMKAAEDLYNIRDTYFPSNPDDKISRLQAHSDLALNLLDSTPSASSLAIWRSFASRLPFTGNWLQLHQLLAKATLPSKLGVPSD